MAADGGTPGEFSANVETFADARGVDVPDHDDPAYGAWKAAELWLWHAYVSAGLAVVTDGDPADTSDLARVEVTGFVEINGPLVANAQRTATQRNAAFVARCRPSMTPTERSKVKRENDRRVALGLSKMSDEERDDWVDELRCNEHATAQRTATHGNAIPTYLPTDLPVVVDDVREPEPERERVPTNPQDALAQIARVRNRCGSSALHVDELVAALGPRAQVSTWQLHQVWEVVAALLRNYERGVVDQALSAAVKEAKTPGGVTSPRAFLESVAGTSQVKAEARREAERDRKRQEATTEPREESVYDRGVTKLTA